MKGVVSMIVEAIEKYPLLVIFMLVLLLVMIFVIVYYRMSKSMKKSNRIKRIFTCSNDIK